MARSTSTTPASRRRAGLALGDVGGQGGREGGPERNRKHRVLARARHVRCTTDGCAASFLDARVVYDACRSTDARRQRRGWRPGKARQGRAGRIAKRNERHGAGPSGWRRRNQASPQLGDRAPYSPGPSSSPLGPCQNPGRSRAAAVRRSAGARVHQCAGEGQVVASSAGCRKAPGP